MEKQEDSGKAEKLFTNFGKKVDQFMVELKEASGRVQNEFETRFEELATAGTCAK
jgi:hypothetical protein